MLFIGETRFSLYVPNSSAWVASNNSQFKTEDEYKSYLFSEKRLDLRTDFFLNVSVPLLAKASLGYGYYHVVSYSDHLPAKYEQKLIKAAEQYPFLILNKYKNGHCSNNTHHLALRLYRNSSFVRPANEPIGFFRLDDDDLVSLNYFALMSRYVTSDHIGYRVSLSKGVTGFLDSNMQVSKFFDVHKPMIAIGLMEVGTVSESGKIILPQNAPHTLSDTVGPIILDAQEIAWFWGRHSTQDTAIGTSTDTLTHELQRYKQNSNFENIKALFSPLKIS